MAGAKLSSAILVLLVVLGIQCQSTVAQFSMTVTSPVVPTGNGPNTFLATSDQIGSSLLGSGTPSILWGVVQSSDVTLVCQQMTNTGSLSFTTTVIDSTSGFQEDLTIQILSTGGCEAASDESGTEAVLVDNYGRTSALVCPSNAGSSGCGVYLTGDDVSAIYNQGSRRRLLGSSSRKLLDCKSGAGEGAIEGAITGTIESLEDCLEMGPLFLLCMIGAVGVKAGIGAAEGCAEHSSCFPGDAIVQTANGALKKMTELSLGDKVAVWNEEGILAYEDIYAFGHKDSKATSEFLKISMSPSGSNMTDGLGTMSLELSALHFAPIPSGLGGKEIFYKRARDINVGDTMWASPRNTNARASYNGALAAYTVTGISTVVKQGLYNPFTMTGTIVVNGVVASVHSDWFLDGLFDALRVTHLLPAAYQVALTPPRILYTILGKDAYSAVYVWLDSRINLVQLVSDYSS